MRLLSGGVAVVLFSGVLVGAAGVQPAAATELVTNGSFESPQLSPGAFTIVPSIPGWSETNGCGVEVQNQTVTSSYDGNQLVELAGNCPGGIQQTLSTVTNIPYFITFAFRSRPGSSPFENTAKVMWAGTDVLNVQGTQQWVVYHVPVTATSSSTVLQFIDTNTSCCDSLGDFVDAVSVSEASAATDLSVTKTGPATVSPGSTIAYTVTVTNSSTAPAKTVTLTDPTPSGMTFNSETQTSGPAFTCTNPAPSTAGTTTCTNDTLAAGASAVFRIIDNLSGTTTATSVANTATVSSYTPDKNVKNNTATATSTVAQNGSASADLAIAKTGPSSAAAGSIITYTITVTNNGPGQASPVGMTDGVPSGTQFEGGMQASGVTFSCTAPPIGAGTGQVACNNSGLAPGGTAVFKLRFKIVAASGSAIENTAQVGSTGTQDPNPANNQSTVSTNVT
jgi:uncharacterized repeat protein (TIGR01451 family)